MQEERLLPNLTGKLFPGRAIAIALVFFEVRETLTFVAELKLPAEMTREQKIQRVRLIFRTVT